MCVNLVHVESHFLSLVWCGSLEEMLIQVPSSWFKISRSVPTCLCAAPKWDQSSFSWTCPDMLDQVESVIMISIPIVN
ncbi:hypothetical protein AVEN_128677-1 [Araneus ventricosus]|uniref:Uncharacterized protein n=1 Tax=Araneus ventricosus TaxID=182803 RepID=A0A4Y2MLQ1_ARAVE|nr:hypothetical protein AVEN_128677-1 [Araneus ventricosus]